MSSTRTSKCNVWLYGTPIFSLSYSTDPNIKYSDLANFTDASGYRPDPRDILEKNKKYKALCKFGRETNYNGQDIWILREIDIDGIYKFVYIR